LYEDELIIPEVLGNNGYTCGMFGKWHLGDNYPFRPEDRGFDEVVRHGGGGIVQLPDYWGNDYFDDTYWHNGNPKEYEGYCTDVFFEEAMRFIEEHKEKPFFCYLSTNAPHGPFNVPVEYMNRYQNMDQVPERLKRFYGMITNIDDNFKKLENHLERLGLKENTLLIFMTDNGTALGHTLYDGGLRGNKGSEYEGGHRVPFMIRWPEGKIGGGQKVKTLTAHYDVLPTLVDMLDLEFTPKKPLDGTSLLPLLEGKTKSWPNRILYMDTQRELDLVKYKRYSVMDENWRLVNGNELYNMQADLHQDSNLIEEYPEVAARLAEGYERWWQSIIDEGVEERFAYIKAGSARENPVKVCSQDMRSPLMHFWHQYHPTNATQGTGIWKIEIVEEGDYHFHLRRFPRESGLGFNDTFPEAPCPPELENSMPASKQVGFVEGSLEIADFIQTEAIEALAEELSFAMHLKKGKYDMGAILKDQAGLLHPAYFVYIEKVN
jgi:arylsulfatase A-like enzyme